MCSYCRIVGCQMTRCELPFPSALHSAVVALTEGFSMGLATAKKVLATLYVMMARARTLCHDTCLLSAVSCESASNISDVTFSSSTTQAEQRVPADIGTPPSPTMASGVDARLLKSTKFPSEFNQKVDMQKVNLQVMKKSDTVTSSALAGLLTFLQMDRQQNVRNPRERRRRRH